MTTSIVKDKSDEFLKKLVGTVREEVYEQIKWVALDDLVGVTSKLSVEDCYFVYDENLNLTIRNNTLKGYDGGWQISLSEWRDLTGWDEATNYVMGEWIRRNPR